MRTAKKEGMILFSLAFRTKYEMAINAFFYVLLPTPYRIEKIQLVCKTPSKKENSKKDFLKDQNDGIFLARGHKLRRYLELLSIYA